MKSFLPILLLLSALWLCSCQEEGAIGHEEERVRREVDQRVDAIRSELKVSENRWHTIRIVAFCLLAGGSLIWLFHGGGTVSGRGGRSVLPDDKNPEPGYRRRVIDRYYPDEDESDEYPYRR